MTIDDANKLIFVKEYEAAEKIIETLVQKGDGRQDLLVHLRRIELASRLGKLDKIRAQYLDVIHKDGEGKAFLARVAKAYTEQLGEMVSPHEAVEEFQSLLQEYGAHACLYYGIAVSMEVIGHLERAEANYNECLKHDANWYPAYFGLSQIKYQQNDEKMGDYYFFLFEKNAPYNVYGNFETHRKLANEFMANENYTRAITAIQSLADWWVENRQVCPPEIQIYTSLMTAKIQEQAGHTEVAKDERERARIIAQTVLNDETSTEGVLYFIAKAMEEFSQVELSLKFYKRVLSLNTGNPELVQKIGGQFLALKEYNVAKDLFEEAYRSHPDNSEIRFCLLIAKLKLANVDVEDYLSLRERMRLQWQSQSDKVELLSLLHTLTAKFREDPEVQANMGETYLSLGNPERAARHFQSMLASDPLSQETRLRYAAFATQYGDRHEARRILESLQHLEKGGKAWVETFWLRSLIAARDGEHRKAQSLLQNVLSADPWNVSYIVQEIQNLTHIAETGIDITSADTVIAKLAAGMENDLDWPGFDERTRYFEEKHNMAMVYAREKLRFLYSDGHSKNLGRLVSVACKFDPNRGAYDFLRLLNTNFDGPHIYMTLGSLYKEMWQLETASMWFEQTLQNPSLNDKDRARAYLELADCYVWRTVNVNKAIEYAKCAMELNEKEDEKTRIVLVHAYLKGGQIRDARNYLHKLEVEKATDAEYLYLKGLMHYRNGAEGKAKEIWKPLLTVRSESLRFHHIKQEIMQYYYDKASYHDLHFST